MESKDLTPGTKLRYLPDGSVVVLDRRKSAGDRDYGYDLPFWPGWWLRGDRGGLADMVIDKEDGAWEVIG